MLRGSGGGAGSSGEIDVTGRVAWRVRGGAAGVSRGHIRMEQGTGIEFLKIIVE